MVKELRLFVLVLTVLTIPLFASSIDILISADTFPEESNPTINFQTDEIGSCFFISGDLSTSEAVYKLLSLFNYGEDEQSYTNYLALELDEEPVTSHEISITLEDCKEFTQANCYGLITCCSEDYFAFLDEETIFDENIINAYCNAKQVSFGSISEYSEPTPTSTITPIPTIEQTATPVILSNPIYTPAPTNSPDFQMTLEEEQGEEEEICIPDCTNKVCGSDGCGGNCGVCSANEQCYLGECISYREGPKEEKIENIIGFNFQNNSILNSSEQLIFQTSQDSICFFNDGNDPVELDSSNGMLHTFPKSHLVTGENNLSISCIAVDNSVEDTMFYSFEIAEEPKVKKASIGIIIIIVSIVALVFTISTILIVIFLISPKKKDSTENLTVPIKFQQEKPFDAQIHNNKPSIVENQKRVIPRKHLDHIFDQFLDDNFDYKKRYESSGRYSKADSGRLDEDELEQLKNSEYIDLTDSTKKDIDNYKTNNDNDSAYVNASEKSITGNGEDTKIKSVNGNSDKSKKQSDNYDDKSGYRTQDKSSLDPTKELAKVMINAQLANKEPLSSEDIIDIIRNLGLKDSSQVSALFSTLFIQGKAKKEQLLTIIQDMRKLNIIDEMQALEILSESNLLD